MFEGFFDTMRVSDSLHPSSMTVPKRFVMATAPFSASCSGVGVGLSPFLGFPVCDSVSACRVAAAVKVERSGCRASRVPRGVRPWSHEVSDPAGFRTTSPIAAARMLPKIGYKRSGILERDFGAQYSACTYPCQRLICTVTGADP